jgi:ribonuclease P protein component
MFKKENRLVPGVRFNNSHSVIISQFILKEKKNELTVNRFGIIVSKKIDKRAVVRNKIKRFLRTTLMDSYGKMSVGHDILIIVKKGISGKTKEENLLAIENALGKAGVIKVND